MSSSYSIVYFVIPLLRKTFFYLRIKLTEHYFLNTYYVHHKVFFHGKYVTLNYTPFLTVLLLIIKVVSNFIKFQKFQKSEAKRKIIQAM